MDSPPGAVEVESQAVAPIKNSSVNAATQQPERHERHTKPVFTTETRDADINGHYTSPDWDSEDSHLLGWLQVGTSNGEDIIPGELVLLKHCATVCELTLPSTRLEEPSFAKVFQSTPPFTSPQWDELLTHQMVTQTIPAGEDAHRFWYNIVRNQRLPEAQQPDLHSCKSFDYVPKISVTIDAKHVDLKHSKSKGPRDDDFYKGVKRMAKARQETYGVPPALIQKTIEEDISRLMISAQRLHAEVKHLQTATKADGVDKARLHELEAEYAELTSTLQRVQAQEAKIAELESEVGDKLEELQRTIYAVADFSKNAENDARIPLFSAMLNSREGKIKALKAKIQELGGHLKTFQMYAETLVEKSEKNLKDYEALKQEHAEAIETLKREHDAMIESMAKKHKTEVETLEKDIKALRSESKMHKSKGELSVKSLKRKHDAVAESLEKHKTQVATLEQDNKALKTESNMYKSRGELLAKRMKLKEGDTEEVVADKP
ncbi:hypothetical protein OHC33_008683 [Knufia fluminis]|uniref:Uncharacterized protein n=1 Tax=Knufia fluminis TaxID=191047 RepID=A0AAN8EBM4_9EURO|nr:hypothetical protein OHC33_008683 [Knufia fluminis]